MPIRVLIADDHAVVRQGLRLLLQSENNIEVVGEAADGEMAVQLALSLKPDVILLDLLMPVLNGLDATRRLGQLDSQSRVLILTSSLDEQLIRHVLQAGARGYILKASKASELVLSIERVAQGQTYLDAAATQALVHQVQNGEPLQGLTSREREVFEALAHGLSNAEIANKLTIGEATVRTHIASVLEKLELRDRTQVTIYALKRGLLRLEDLQ